MNVISRQLGMLNCGGDYLISQRSARGEAMKVMARIERRKCLIKSTYIGLILIHNSVVCSVYEADRIDVTIMRQSYSATNWQQEVCDFQNALNSPSYFYPNLLQTSSEYCKNMADVKL